MAPPSPASLHRGAAAARETLKTLLIFGVLSAVVGGGLFGWWAEANADGGADGGPTLLLLTGLVAMAVGQALITVALVGYGVMLGRQASPRASA